jgi:hypothetical protein
MADWMRMAWSQVGWGRATLRDFVTPDDLAD